MTRSGMHLTSSPRDFIIAWLFKSSVKIKLELEFPNVEAGEVNRLKTNHESKQLVIFCGSCKAPYSSTCYLGYRNYSFCQPVVNTVAY